MTIDPTDVARYLLLGAHAPDAALAARIDALRTAALRVIRPARTWRRGDLADWRARSATLALRLAGCHAVYLACGTLGAGFDALARRMIELAGLVPGQDIEIAYTGLRPGEKLYEEVLSNKENTDETSHDRIRIARVREYAYDDAVKAVEELAELSGKVDIPATVKLMKAVVPEYVSKNSRFEEYDKKD